MLKAFILGGIICTLGQFIFHYFQTRNLSPEDCGCYTSILLVLLSVLLTGSGIYPKLAKWGGAGALVPITGFANSVGAPTIKYKKKSRSLASAAKSSWNISDEYHRKTQT